MRNISFVLEVGLLNESSEAERELEGLLADALNTIRETTRADVMRLVKMKSAILCQWCGLVVEGDPDARDRSQVCSCPEERRALPGT